MADASTQTDDVGGSAYDAILRDVEDRNFGTDDADLRSYAETGGAAGGAAACTALGAPAAAPICATIGSKIGGAIYDGIKWITHSGPDESELQGARRATVDALREAFVQSANAATEKTYDTIRQATRAMGAQATDAQISEWLGDVARRFGFWYVTDVPPIIRLGNVSPGNFTWCIACNAPRDPTVAGGFGQHMTSESDATVAEYRAKTIADFTNIVRDLRACAVSVLALLAAHAIHVPTLFSRAVFVPATPKFSATTLKSTAESSSEVLDPNKPSPKAMVVGGVIAGGLGAGVGGLVFGSRRAALIGGAVGAALGAWGGAVAGRGL